MEIRPISVPSMPKAGAKAPMAWKMSAPRRCLDSWKAMSVSKISTIAWGSRPSTVSWRPFWRKLSETSPMSFSSDSSPSLRALAEKVMNPVIMSPTVTVRVMKAFFKMDRVLRQSSKG